MFTGIIQKIGKIETKRTGSDGAAFIVSGLGSEDGVGLGLSLSYQIIKDHQGFINIESELNKGTKIIILLPI